MLPYLLGLATLVALLVLGRLYVSANPATLALVARRGAGALALALAALLAIYGRLLLAAPLGLLGLLLIMRGPPSLPGTGSTPGRRTSTVRTAFLEMTLDHDSGTMHGRVLAGSLAGRDLAGLSRAEQRTLWEECRAAEPQSRQLYEAYLDRVRPEWRQEMGGDGARQGAAKGGEASTARPSNGRMTSREALEILGLEQGASVEEIKAAHRNLMKRLHPDQGGTTYLAAKINEAKDVLLGRTG